MDPVVLSIVILNYKTKHLLRLILKNLLKLGITEKFEIIVVDNASNDGTVEMVQTLYPEVKLIKNPTNTGHAHGNNLGIKAAQGKYLLIMNSDITVFDPKDITHIVEYLDANPKVALLGPKLLNADDSLQYSCFRPYSTLTPLYRRTPLGKLNRTQKDLQRHLMTDFDHNSIQEVDWLLGAVLFARRAVLEQYGPFDEHFFLYFADFELCDRIRFYNYKVIYYPNVHMVHYHRRESAEGSIWGGLGSLLNYTTRIHLTDWFTYRRINKQGYDTNTRHQIKSSTLSN
jgi:GT2 family glycosyltransferase